LITASTLDLPSEFLADCAQEACVRLLRYDRMNNEFQLVDSGDGNAAMSEDGQKVVFMSDGANVTSDNTNGLAQVYFSDLSTGLTSLVSRNKWGAALYGSVQAPLGISADGNFFGLVTSAENYGVTGQSINQTFVEPTAAFAHDSDEIAPQISDPAWSANPVAAATTGGTTLMATVSDDLSGVVAGEFYVGMDPGIGQGEAQGNRVTVSGSTVTATIYQPSTPGVYQVGVRVRDAANNWSNTVIDSLVVFDSIKTRLAGHGAVVPTFGSDILPGLIASDQTDKGKFDFLAVYKNGVINPNKSSFNFSYKTGTHCAGAHPSNCHDTALVSTSIGWLVADGTNNSHVTAQGAATLTIDGVTTTNPYRLEGLDGSLVGPLTLDHFVLKVFAPGSNPAVAAPLYSVAQDLIKGDIKIVPPPISGGGGGNQ
jgi:hypothetical protein